MKEIILIAGVCGLFIFFLYLFSKMIIEKKKETKKEEPQPEKPKKEEIPEIIKEVTMGNYMHDISQVDVVDGVEMPENEDIDIKETVKTYEEMIEDSFDEVDTLGDDFDGDIDIEVDEITDEIEEIDDYADDIAQNAESINGDKNKGKNQNKEMSTQDEIHKLSKKMKAVLIANVLDRNHKN